MRKPLQLLYVRAKDLVKIDFKPRKNFYDKVFLYLLIFCIILRLIWLDLPEGSLIFDEKYYVNVARNIIGIPHDPDVYPDAASGLDPNHEHPPLAKLILAFSMLIIGDNAYGYRLPSVIFGTLIIFIFYLLVKKISKSDMLALISAFLLSFDNLIFVHSRIATLDIFMLAFMIMGFYLYFQDRIALSGIMMALSTLCKIGGIYGLATIALYHILVGIRDARGHKKGVDWATILGGLERFGIAFTVTFIGLLTILDRVWVSYRNPFEHLVFIYNYTRGLTRDVPEGIESYPWQWLLNEVKIPYLTVNVDVRAGENIIESYPSVAFQGAMNPLIIYLTIPSIIYAIYKFSVDKDDFTLFMVAWFCCTYLPFIPMSMIWHRISYIFYFLSTVPSVCGAIAYFLIDQKPPKILIIAYLVAVLIGFKILFPFKIIP